MKHLKLKYMLFHFYYLKEFFTFFSRLVAKSCPALQPHEL